MVSGGAVRGSEKKQPPRALAREDKSELAGKCKKPIQLATKMKPHGRNLWEGLGKLHLCLSTVKSLGGGLKHYWTAG